MQERRKFNKVNILLVLIFLIGLGILLYPNISDYLNQRNSSKAVSEYDEAMAEMNEEVRQATLHSANDYNTKLSKSYSRFAEMTEQEYEQYMGELNVNGEGMMCYLKIDKLGVNLPVYHGTTEDVLQRYVGHVEGTSLPTGGLGTHCALSGHRGLPSAVLFTNLDRLVVGDTFSIFVLGEEHEYVIDQIEIVLPDDMSLLEIDPEKDFCTLITCTPYGVNTHRMMVRGVRVPEGEKAEDIVQIDESDRKDKLFDFTREQVVNMIAVGMTGGFFFIGLPLIIFIPVGKKEMVLRPWDDNIVEVIDASVIVSAFATRANWEVSGVAKEADWLASLRRWDDDMGAVDEISEREEGPLDELDVIDELDRLEEEEYFSELMKLDGVPEGRDVYAMLAEMKEAEKIETGRKSAIEEERDEKENKEFEELADINKIDQVDSEEENSQRKANDEPAESDEEGERILTEEEQELYDSITEKVNGKELRDESLLYDKLLISGKYEERPWDDYQYEEEDILTKTVKQEKKEEKEEASQKKNKKKKKTKKKADSTKTEKNRKDANVVDQDNGEEKKEEEYFWDNDILEKVDQDWGKLDPNVQKVALPFIDIKKVLEDKKYGTAEEEDAEK